MWQTSTRNADHLWRPIVSSGRRFGLIALIGIIGLAACQSHPAPPAATPVVYTATPAPVSVTPAPTALPAVLPIGLDNPHHAAIQLLNGLNQTPVDVYLEQTLIGSALAYGTPTPPTAFAPGSYTLRLFRAGDAPTAANMKFGQSIKLPDGLSGLIVITGTLDKSTITLLVNDLSPIPAGQIRISAAAFGAAAAFPINVTADQQSIASLTSPGTLAKSVLQPAALQSVTFSPPKGDLVKSSGPFSERQAYLLVLLASSDPAVQSGLIVIGNDSQRNAQIRIVNASLDLAAADVKLNDQSVASALAFGQATDWQTVAAGSNYSLSVSGILQAAPTIKPTPRRAVGTAAATQPVTQLVPTASASNTPAPRFATTLDLPTDAQLDIILYGPASALQVQTLSEDFSSVASGQARLELFNAVPGTSGVLPFTEGSPLAGFSGVDYGQSSGPALIAAGPLAAQFRAIDASGTVQVVEFKPAFTYNASTAYLYVLTGSANTVPPIVLDTPVQTSAAAVVGATTTPSGALQFRLLNAMSDGTAVSLSLNGQPIFSNVAAEQSTAYQAIGSQFATWSLAAASSPQTALAKADLVQIGQGTVTLVVVGTAQAARFFQVVDNIPTGVSDALLDVIHAAPNVLALRVEVQSAVATAPPAATESESFVEPGLTVATQAATQSAVATSASGPLTATPFGSTAQAIPTAILSPTPVQHSLVIADRLQYSGLSSLQAIPSGAYTLIIRDNASGATLGQLNSITINADQRYDVLLLPADASGALKIVVVASALPNPVTSP